jgi:ADP-ribose pyrophosphatase YjhB (NUDIX family)
LGSSAAGYLHAGESYAAAAARRLAEEIDVTTPLAEVGQTSMHDGGATKFVRVYLAPVGGARPRVVDPGHVEAVEFWDIGDVDELLRDDPGAFTPTFPTVFRYFTLREERPGPTRGRS